MPIGPDLITVEELKLAKGESSADTEHDEKYQQAIRNASTAVRRFADRAFGMPYTEGDRIYNYDESGYLDTDDAGEVIKVTFILGTLETELQRTYWRAEPQEGPPYNYLYIPRWAGIYSPQMGFRYNLDRISQERGWPGLNPQVKVRAKWGWPEVPDDVRQATIWTAAKFAEKPDQMISESIANYSYTSQVRGNAGPPPAIPAPAQDVLAAYVRFQI